MNTSENTPHAATGTRGATDAPRPLTGSPEAVSLPPSVPPAATQDGAPARTDSVLPQEPPAVTGAQRAIGHTLGRPRPRGRRGVALAAAAAAAIVLIPLGVAQLGDGSAGHASDPASTTATVVDADGELSSVLEVAGRVGSVPVLALHGSLGAVSTVRTDTLIQGQGQQVAAGSPALLSVSTFSGTDGSNTTGTTTGTRLYRGAVSPEALGEVLAGAVTGTTEGSRLVVRAPVTDAEGGIRTEVTVVDVLPVLASGEVLSPVQGAPKATVDEHGTLSVDLTGTTAPSLSTATTLVRGQGQQVQATDTVVARYAIVDWATGATQTSTYGQGVVPGTIDMGNTLAGIAQYLVDVPVGSRVLLSLSSDQARGDGAVAVVIDVLAVGDHGSGASSVPQDGASSPGVVVVTPAPAPSS